MAPSSESKRRRAAATSRSTAASTRSAATARAAPSVRPDQVVGEQRAGAGQRVVGGLGVEVDGPLLDRAVGEDDDEQRVQRGEADELDRADGGRARGEGPTTTAA